MQRWCCILALILSGTFLAPPVAKALPSISRFISDPIDTSSLASRLTDKAQSLQDSLASLQQLPGRYFNKVSSKADQLNQQLSKRTAKALGRLQKQEEKINSKLGKIDSLAAKNLFSQSIDSLSHLRELVQGKVSQAVSHIPGGQYLAHLDTLQSALGFLSKYQSRLSGIQGADAKIQQSLASVQQLEGRLDQLQQVQQYIGVAQKHRKAFVSCVLGQKSLEKCKESHVGRQKTVHLRRNM